MYRSLFLILIILFSAGCKKEKNTEKFTVSGQISNIDAGASEVTLRLSNSENTYTGSVPSTGEFTIAGVAAGSYMLKVLQEKTQGHVERNINADVTRGDLHLDIKLPDPVLIFSPAHTDRSITVTWTRSTDDGFREYKVYRAYNAGLDETTGELIQVFTESTDTMFVDMHGMASNDGLLPGYTYFYRVMVMDDYGKLAGSNVLQVTTDTVPPLPELYSLDMAANFSGNANYGGLWGIAFDGKNLWMAYWNTPAGFYDSSAVTLVQYDLANHQELKTFIYRDIFGDVGGLEFDGFRLWLSYSLTNNGNLSRYSGIDTSSGQKLNTFSADYGVEDLAYYDGALYLNYYYNMIDKVDPANGGLIERYHTNLPSGTNCRGLAVRSGEMWINHWLIDPGILYILDENAQQKGFVHYTLDGTRLCFMNSQMVMIDEARVYIFNIIPKKK